MGRICLICDKGLGTFVRQLSRQNKTPSAIVRIIKEKHGFDISYWQYRNHVKMHDPVAGTYIVAKRRQVKNLEESLEVLNNSKRIVSNIMNLTERFTAFQENITEDDFLAMTPTQQTQIIRLGVETALNMKKIEMQQQKLDMDKSMLLDDVFKLASRAKPFTIKQQDGSNTDEGTAGSTD